MYFKAMPNMVYPYKTTVSGKQKENVVVVKDIFRRVQLEKFIKNKTALEAHYIKDGETPEILAYQAYGSTKYHWVLLVINEIVDPRKEWPLTTRELIKYVKQKYGDSDVSSVHHYVRTADKVTIEDWDAAKLSNGDIEAVTNFQHEDNVNEAKRQIYLLNSRQLNDFVQQFKKLVR